MNSVASKRQKGRISVADYISQQIELSGKKQKDIAEELNYEKPNMITMIKQGRTPLPINKITPIAKALNIDPIHLFRHVMMEYHPHTWEAFESVMGQYAISKNEMEILEVVRETAQGQDVKPETEEDKAQLKALVEKWRKRQEDMATTVLRKDIEKKEGI